MTDKVQISEKGFARKWTMADIDTEISANITAMAAGSFNLIAVAAIKLSIGVYVDKLALPDVLNGLTKDMIALNYGKSSRYALTSAARDVARDLVKRLGHPAAAERNAFWQMLEESETVVDATALMVAAIKSNYNVDTVQGLSLALRGEAGAKPRTEKPLADKIETAMADASPVQALSVASQIINDKVNPSDVKALILNVAHKLSAEDLNEVAAALAEMISAKVEAEAPAKKAA